MTYPHGGAASIWRDNEAGSPHNPSKSQIRDWGANLEARLSPLIAAGAVGDGAADDASFIDGLNLVGATVDLGGLTYAYTGDFDPAAHFVNGVIVSSTKGTFDYASDIINQDIEVTVGAGGTFKFLKSALDWLKAKTITGGSVTLRLLEHNTPDTSAGSMALDHYMFDHPQSSRVILRGPAMSGAVPEASDMTGVKATDVAFVKSRYNASIYLPGAGISGSYGLAVPNGLGGIQDLAVFSDTRYSIDVGFNGSHHKSVAGKAVRLSNYCGIGGIWGVIARGAVIVCDSPAFFGYQEDGGPVDSLGSDLRADAFEFRCYTNAASPKYCINMEDGSIANLNNMLRCDGPFLHGLRVTGGSTAYASAAQFDGVTQPLTCESGSYADIGSSTIANADPANTSAIIGSAQFGHHGYGGTASQNLIFSGSGSFVSCASVAVSSSVCRAVVAAFHGRVANYGHPSTQVGSISVDDVQSTTATIWASTSGPIQLGLNVTNPRAGSNNLVDANALSQVYLTDHSGMSFSPALDTPTNGNLITATA